MFYKLAVGECCSLEVHERGIHKQHRTYIIIHNPVLVLFVINLQFELISGLNYLLRLSSEECAQGHG